jgi:general secretion pathway protein D
VSSTQSPVFTKRVAETSVVVAENETLILGGLIEERKVREREGLPFLSRIPILGYLFGATTDAVRKTELLIMITPRLVPGATASRSLYENLTRRTPTLRRELSPERPAWPAPPPSSPSPRGFAPEPELPTR